MNARLVNLLNLTVISALLAFGGAALAGGFGFQHADSAREIYPGADRAQVLAGVGDTQSGLGFPARPRLEDTDPGSFEAELRALEPNLVISKTVTPTVPVVPGASITYILDLANSGAYTATGVVISDIVPVSVTVASVISSGVAITVSSASPGYVWNVQNLAPGQGGVITITAVLSAPLAAGAFTNTATIAAAEAESDYADNESDAGVTVSSCLATPDDGATLYPTVQGAVDAANSGDTVKVAGSCVWSPAPSGQQNLLTISQTLTIAGGYTQTNWLTAYPITQPTTLDAEYNGRVLYVEGAGITVTVKGLTLQRGSGGNVYASYARVLMSDCAIISATVGYGLSLYESDGSRLENSLVAGNSGYGVHADGSEYVTLQSNTISGNNSSGVYFYVDNNNATLNANTISSNGGRGVYLYQYNYYATLGDNIITNNSEYGVHLYRHNNDVTLNDNAISNNNGYGVFLNQYNDYAALNHNTVSGNTGDGVRIYTYNYAAALSDNTITSNGGHGVLFYGQNNDVILSDNTVSGNGSLGVYLYQDNYDATLSHNVIISNSLSGVVAGYGNGSSLGGNTIADNGSDGVYFYDSSDLGLDNNIIARNGGDGVRLHSASAALRHNTVVSNTGGEGLRVGPNSTLVLTNTIVASHTTGILTSDPTANVQADHTLWHANSNDTDSSGGGTIVTTNDRSGDPRFVGGLDPFAAYHIQVGSFAIDAGTDAGLSSDIDGQSRLAGFAPDLGADEFIPTAPAAVAISGPTTGFVQASYAFTVAIEPVTTTLPITFVWQTAGQSPVTHTGGLSDTAAFAWSASGAQTITVTATNAGGMAVGVHVITISDVPISGLSAINDSPTPLGQATTLTATVTAGSNVTYTWAFGDGDAESGPIVLHTYPAAGIYTALVTASNTVSVLTATTTVTITNTPPTLSGLPDQIFDETASLPGTIDLWAFASDGEIPASGLTYTIEGSPPAGAGVTIVGNRWLTIDPSTNWCGWTDVMVRATDPGGLWDEDAFRVAVTWSCQG